MGAGFHGKSGLKQSTNANIWMKYVISRHTYGLEVLNLRKKDIAQVDAFQRWCMKQLQALPNRTSDTAALALMGALPVSVCVEKNILSLFGRVVRDQLSIENDIAVRQLEYYWKELVLQCQNGAKCVFTSLGLWTTE